MYEQRAVVVVGESGVQHYAESLHGTGGILVAVWDGATLCEVSGTMTLVAPGQIDPSALCDDCASRSGPTPLDHADEAFTPLPHTDRDLESPMETDAEPALEAEAEPELEIPPGAAGSSPQSPPPPPDHADTSPRPDLQDASPPLRDEPDVAPRPDQPDLAPPDTAPVVESSPTPVDQAPADQAPADQAPAAPAPVDQAPTEQAPPARPAGAGDASGEQPPASTWSATFTGSAARRSPAAVAAAAAAVVFLAAGVRAARRGRRRRRGRRPLGAIGRLRR
ncbi:MAG: hypothetical protein H0V05_20510 [Euzebyaceae bacterium]|nr:hypothetical protein [Euzebyaceae bacterium]